MGLTLIRKSPRRGRKKNPRIALVLAGGAVSGGAFKVGGLKALNDFFVDRDITDFDMYVGLSAGSILAVPLAAGIEPEEMVRVLEGTSERFEQLRPIDFYNLNWREFIERPAKLGYDTISYLPGVLYELIRDLPALPEYAGDALRTFVKEPNYTHLEAVAMRVIDHVSPSRQIPALTNHVPSGLFDNVGLERWLRRSLERMDMPNDFRSFTRKNGKQLYIGACDLDSAERVIFGADANSEVTISQAVQASTALPGFYKPARVGGVDYVDGGIRNTANIDVAIEKGADLIVCYNPFRPFLNRIDEEGNGKDNGYFAEGRYLSDRGLKVVINQVFRTLLHSRLKLALQRYVADDRFKGDIVLLEPREHDATFFGMNPLAFWKRADAMRHGFESVRATVLKNFEALEELFAQYDLPMSVDAAGRKAEAIRTEQGWDPDSEAGEDPRPPLRLVGS